jgi:hypothetical protein
VINPDDFVPQVNNQYFTLKPGTKFSYETKTPRGLERVEEAVTNETKKVMGVTTTVVRVREWLNGVLKEDSRDWYAQDKAGNVWYFGEAVDKYVDGKLANHKGSWEAGVGGAKPGLIMPGNPRVGETFRQEYLKGIAEDMGTIVATDAKVTVPHATFENCLQVHDWTLLKPGADVKYYCPAIGFMALELEKGVAGVQRVELVSVTSDSSPTE